MRLAAFTLFDIRMSTRRICQTMLYATLYSFDNYGERRHRDEGMLGGLGEIGRDIGLF